MRELQNKLDTVINEIEQSGCCVQLRIGDREIERNPSLKEHLVVISKPDNHPWLFEE